MGLALGQSRDAAIEIVQPRDDGASKLGQEGAREWDELTTAVGAGTSTAEGVSAATAKLTGPTEVILDLDENLVICDGTKVRRVDGAGVITTFAGGGTPADGLGDGLQATKAKLVGCEDMAMGRDGTLYITASNSPRRVRSVSTDGIMRTVAGNGLNINPFTTPIPWGVSAPIFPISAPEGIAVSPDGRLFVAEDRFDAIVEVGPDPVPTSASGEYLVPSRDGSEIYTFDSNGRHQTTLDATSGEAKWTFEYETFDGNQLLGRVIDHEGKVTELERDAEGRPTALVGPYGHRTTLTMGADGYLASVENPAGETTSFTYDSGAAAGLLLTKTDPGGGVHTYGYDEAGRLISDASPTGRAVALARTDSTTGHTVTYTTSEGRTTRHEVSEESAGVVRRKKTDARGGLTETVTAADGTSTVTYPDGRSLTVTRATSDRFGGVLPMNEKLVVKLASGLTTTIQSTESVTLTDPTDLLSVETITQTSVIDGHTYTRVFDAAGRTETETSP